MDTENVVKLIELMEAHGLDEIEVAEGEMHIRLKKAGKMPTATPIIAAHAPVVAAANGVVVPQANNAEPAQNSKEKDTVEITSPMVGTFYRSSSPDAGPFVSKGDHVTPDSVVCIIEAMKVMNEIKAEAEGEIVSILVENGESVEYGQPIMVVRPTAPSE